MKTTKLLIGISGAVLAMAAFAAPAPAQVSGGTTRDDGGRGVILKVVHPIIFDHEVADPNPILRRHLRILADGAATLVEGSGPDLRVIKGRVKPADMAALEDLAAQLDQPGDVTTGAAADGSDAGGTTLTVGLLKVRRHVVMGRPVARMLARRLEQIALKLAAE
jgi:hypothetical protein